ncbi:MAG: hypothetical protein MUC33_01395 [Desulfobacterales bacterium]|nr:hypothetical protein [Desulfobacterales bacterium]MCU0601298.1 hypothetical protein [Desulfobacterales bacterium]
MTEYATTEPEKFTAGDLIQWKREAAGLSIPTGEVPKASAGWALTYSLVKSGVRIALTSTPSGDDFLVSLAAATTAGYSPGVYRWQAYVTKTTERYMVGSGTIEILANFAAASSGYDARSHVKKVLDALEAKLEGRASKDQEQMVVGGQVVGMMPIARLLEWYSRYKQAYEQEQAAENVAKGLGTGKNIFVRFGND